ncbi:hypothetical protein DFH28DRAFT_24340 [Melampsora americana]|nr:hypothetical protein DFH28DRAFT_24340 [Melampsora americana]
MSNEEIKTIKSLLNQIQTDSNQIQSELPNFIIPSTLEGISLLSLKNQILSSYLQNLINICILRISGRSSFLSSTTKKDKEKDDDQKRMLRSIEELIWLRLVMEKIKPMELKLKYQIDKLIKKSNEHQIQPSFELDPNELINDPLAFRPNPAAMGFTALVDQDHSSSTQPGSTNLDRTTNGEIYRPPRLAPMAYPDPSSNPTTISSTSEAPRRRSVPAPLALRELAQLSKSQPHEESTSGLGVSAAVASSRARQLARMDDYEESNLIRLVSSKKESKKRRADEAAIALGGQGVTWANGKGVGRRGGLESEFADVLGSISRQGNYASNKKRSSKLRSNLSTAAEDGGGGDPLGRSGKKRQKGSFEKALRKSSKS